MKLLITISAMLLAFTLTAQSQVPTPRYGHSVCKIDGIYYIFGGYVLGSNKSTTDELTNELYKYNPDDLTFTKVTPTGVGIPGMAKSTTLVHNGKLIVLGGTRADSPSNAVFNYTPNTNNWEDAGTQPFTQRSQMAGDTINGNVYLCGGLENNTPQAYLCKYDPINKTFTLLNNIPQGGRYGHTAVNHNGELLIYGGRNANGEQGQMLKYTPTGDYWNFFDPVGMPPTPRANQLSGVLPDEMWIAGGETWTTKKSTNSTTMLGDIWKLDLSQTPARWIKKSENFIPVTHAAGWISVEDNDTLFYSFGGISQITTAGDTTFTNNFYRVNITENIVQQYHEDTQDWGGIITSINESEFKISDELGIFPNPASEQISISLQTNEPLRSVKIFNQNGQLVQQINSPTNNEAINISNLNSGIYFLRIDTSEKYYLGKIIKK